jgi:vitamin B12 transporter
VKKQHLLTLITLLLCSFDTFGQNQDTAAVNLDEIVIAGNRIQLPYSEESRSITLVDAKTIQQTPATSVAEMLHYVSGVDVRTRGANGIQADIGIRGGTFDQTLILVNGIKISDPQTGHHSLNLPVDLAGVERIEVLKGPGARTFGQNAFSGAVNIVTAKPRTSFFRIGVQGGDFGLLGVKAAGALVSGDNTHYLSVNYDQADGYKYNTDYQIFNAFYNGTIALSKGSLELLGGFTDRAFGANGFYASPAYTDQYESIQTGVAALSYKTMVGRVSLETRAYYRQNDDEYLFIRNDPEFYKNNHTNKTLGLEINAVIPSAGATTGLGIDINRVTLVSNNLGNRERNVASMFVEHRMEFYNRRLNITPGIQVNYYSDFGLNALPGIDMGYSLTDNLTMFSSIGYTYRVPTFTDMYYSDPVNVGNPALLPEFAWNYELGLKTRATKLVSAQASVFYRAGNSMIDWVRYTETEPWRPVNRMFLEMAGFDSNVVFDLAGLSAAKNPLFVSCLVNYTYIYSRVLEDDYSQSRYALENLRNQVRLSLNLAYGSKISHSLSAGYYDRVNLDDYTVVDSRLMYKGTKMNFFVDVTNIFDVTYQETNLVVMPGRWFKAGVSVELFSR